MFPLRKFYLLKKHFIIFKNANCSHRHTVHSDFMRKLAIAKI